MVTGATVLDQTMAERYRSDPVPGAVSQVRSGRPLFAGRPYGWEPNAKYQPDAWTREYAPKVALCPPVDTGTNTLIDMVQSATFGVAGGGSQQREYLRRCFGFGRQSRMYDTWESLMRRLLMPAFRGAGGFAWGTWWDRADNLAGPDGTLFLTRLVDIDQSAVVAYLTDEHEQLVGLRVTDSGPAGFGTQDVPIGECLYLCFRPRGATDFDGYGLWRPIAEDAQHHAALGNLLIAGARRFALGEIRVTIDDSVCARLKIQITKEWAEAQSSQMSRWAANRESDPKGHLVPPPWWKVEYVNTAAAYNPQLLVQQRNHHEEVILRQLVAEYLLVGGANGGSYSAAEVKVTRAAAVARNLVDWVLAELDRQVVQRLIRMNWPDLPVSEYPRIVPTGLRAKVFIQYLSQLVQLVTGGIVTPTDALEDAVLEAMELPARTESRTPEQRRPVSPVASEPMTPDQLPSRAGTTAQEVPE